MRTWIPDGSNSALEYTAPELPGTYELTVRSAFAEDVTATAIVRVVATSYDVSTDLIWTTDLENHRVWVGPDGSRALVGGAFFVDLDSGLLESEVPISFVEICRTYGISDRDCPDSNAILIDNDRVLVFDWSWGRPAIFNLADGTIEVAPRPK